MGKIVVIPEHPSNQFFRQFQNVRFFSNDQEFAQQLKAALESEPEPLAAVERYTLSWEIEAAFNELKLEWQRSLLSGELDPKDEAKLQQRE
ncbi:hypothetical protein T492DRAFT_895957 [Pavlovales sp. CCMP2436]|nr:hypothetical protein T492DRAFT_895957 [Pavlovales sp. CCMP2436]